MKANELILGDWVQGHLPNTPSKVVGIPNEYRLAVITQGGAYMELSIDDFLPIPLTPEVLKKNGFDFLYSSVPGGTPQEQRMRKVDTYKWQGIAVNYYHETNDFQMVNFRGVRFDYVHQLQHALRLCGIEKEIVL
jgi:hypothetical protein